LEQALLQQLLSFSQLLQAWRCLLLLLGLSVRVLLQLTLYLPVVLHYCCCQVLQEGRVCMQRQHC
jgi:hypothetical protein